jgi:hypothetical protein
MIDKIHTGQTQDLVEKLPSKLQNTPEDTAGTPPCGKAAPLCGNPNNSADASLQVDYASLIGRAIKIPETNTEAIRKAQELLQFGQLESLERAREAAQNIVEDGI